VQITLGGNATVLIEAAGVRILTDPWLTERLGPLRRLRACGLAPEQLRPLSAVLISHAHPDHLHPESLALLPTDVPLLAPQAPPAARLRALGRGPLHPLAEWQEWEGAGFTVTAVPSIHTRGCLGYVVEVAGRRVYFAGDSGPRTPFAEIARRCGPLDVALLPVGGSTLAIGPLQRHLTPELAARAASELAPRLVIPMHWGHMPCIPSAIDRFRGTADEFVRVMGRLAPGIEVVTPADGEPVTLH
jgi:L-ascorbate metabolism protein UlaG (beta-lactamase superfamily)